MSRRAAVLLVSCATLGYACAPRNRVSNDEPAQQPSASEVATAIDTSSAFAVRLLESTNQRAASFAIEVTNTGKRDEMRFTSGKTQTFSNRKTGVRGSARVTATRTNSAGRPCRTVKQEVKLKDGRSFSDDVNACKGADGGWKS